MQLSWLNTLYTPKGLWIRVMMFEVKNIIDPLNKDIHYITSYLPISSYIVGF